MPIGEWPLPPGVERMPEESQRMLEEQRAALRPILQPIPRVGIWERVREWWQGRRRVEWAPPAGLYVLEVDFPLTDQVVIDRLGGTLDQLKAKYPGMDFLVLEPGMKLRRFNGIK